ncbi:MULTISPECIES: nucleoside-diphosphate kinase [unclassified Actinomyces]|uniref:nucleoside-diphosphate kinase n=1 Tax=unclassified Actinomyces TaxID=2609248 RepID=UPI00201806DF|nr:MULTISPECIES: nucleoside-diphosphate kinase [unclassified Actinomyces]MCL3777967.1 nucleoside-diphosphate kinase [Actinomyces sp. AC-20-1]MCL3789933.1 nucleoside-diphosphate kinase [Actinomyces sp. 187325]MCL3792149.1 nucleoside-diphosphate kinase [Actinomyces sp. 186855]MCL3794893.1 nucleoside-diphosphate kinase [Actinomyces sp. 217892]
MSTTAPQSTTPAADGAAPSTPRSRVLVLLKPDAVERHLTGEVLRRIEAKGYEVTALRMLQAGPRTLAEHYCEHVSKPFYPGIVQYMTRGPVVAAVVEGDRVVEGVRSLMGATDPTTAAPGTIRGDLGRDWAGPAIENLVHGSDSPASAEREIAIWFPELAAPAS